MAKITQTITIELPDIAHFDVYLTENDYTGYKPSRDEEGKQIFDEEGHPVMEPVTKEEYNNYITKTVLMERIRIATRRKQDKVGSLQYNAENMSKAMESIMQVETIIEE